MTDPQDPLPESKFLYRRIFSYVLSLFLIAGIGYIIHQTDDPMTLKAIARYLCLLLSLVITYYMVAPSAEHVVKIIQSKNIFGRRDDP